MSRPTEHFEDRSAGIGVYRDGVFLLEGPMTCLVGNGGDAGVGTPGGSGGDVVIRVRPGCSIHVQDATFPSPHAGRPAKDGTPGGRCGRILIVWDDSSDPLKVT